MNLFHFRIHGLMESYPSVSTPFWVRTE